MQEIRSYMEQQNDLFNQLNSTISKQTELMGEQVSLQCSLQEESRELKPSVAILHESVLEAHEFSKETAKSQRELLTFVFL